jgi:hypothetical protein
MPHLYARSTTVRYGGAICLAASGPRFRKADTPSRRSPHVRFPRCRSESRRSANAPLRPFRLPPTMAGRRHSLPNRSSMLWLFTALILLGFPTLNFIYWPLVLKSGVLPSNGDSIAIPMFSSVLLALAASPVVLSVAWLCFRRYNPRTRFFAFRFDRPYRSTAATMIFGISAVLLCLDELFSTVTPMPWYEYLWTAYTILLGVWLLTLRASLIEQRTINEVEAVGQLCRYAHRK